MYFGLFVYNMETDSQVEIIQSVMRLILESSGRSNGRSLSTCQDVSGTAQSSEILNHQAPRCPGGQKENLFCSSLVVGLCLSTASSFALRPGFHGLHADHPAWLSCARGTWILPAVQPLLDLEETKLAISWVETTSFKLFRIKVAVTTQSGKV